MNHILFDDFYRDRRHQCWPILHGRRHPFDPPMTSPLKDGFRELQLRDRELGEVTKHNEKTNEFIFKCSVIGYLPEELKVDVEGNELIIQGEHQQSGDGQSLQRTFVRRLALPEDILKETIECDIDESGQLEIKAQRQKDGVEHKQKIHIGFKQSESQ